MKMGATCPECGMSKPMSNKAKLDAMPKGDDKAAFAIKTMLQAKSQPKPKKQIKNMIGKAGAGIY